MGCKSFENFFKNAFGFGSRRTKKKNFMIKK